MRHDYKKGYKVVCQNGLKYPLESACELEAIVEYGIGLISKPLPGCGPLAVFGALDDAVRFAMMSQRYLRVYSCRYTPSKKDYQYNRCGKSWPENSCGTILATTVELIEEIKQ